MIARSIAMLIAGLALIGSPAAFAAAPMPDTKQVPTLTVPVAPDPDQSMDGDESGPTPDAPADNAASSSEPAPTVEYDVSKLPPPVKALRERILAAAKTGDIEQLRPILTGGAHPPNLGADENDPQDPVTYLKSTSGDPEGREILAILSEVLEAGYVHVDVGTPQELYVWPYFARYPLDKLTPPQLVELFRLLTASDFDEMKDYGAYLFYRVGITPDGQWSEFQAGD